MPLILQMHQEISVQLLGVLSGAMLMVGVSIFGYWQSLEPSAFADTFGQHALRINSLIIPLTIITILTTAIAAVGAWMTNAPNHNWFIAAAVLVVLAGLMHPVFFMRAGEALQGPAMTPERMTEFLSSWRNWQWVRTALCFAALIASVRGLRAADLATITARSARRVSATVGTPEAPPARRSPMRPARR